MATPRAATDKEAFFFLTILNCMTNKPEVNWAKVAQIAGYSNAGCAKTRYGQIKKAIGYNPDGPLPTPSPIKSRATPKKENKVGSGTNISPIKIEKKPRTPRKSKAVKAAPEPEAEIEQDAANELDDGFENDLHEQFYNGYQVSQDEDEFHDAEEV